MKPKVLSFDTETSIQSHIEKKKRVQSYHGPSWRDPKNDIHTIIYGHKPDQIKVIHSKRGFKRKLPFRVGKRLLESSYICGTNLKFDLGYIWHDKYFQTWLKKGGQVWDIQLVHYLLSAMRHQFASLEELQEYYEGIVTKVNSISKLYKKNIGADEIVQKNIKCKRIWDDYVKYAYQDGATPLLIMRKQIELVKKYKMQKIIKLFNQDLLSLLMMETNGMHIDIAKAEETRQKFKLKELEYIKKAEDIAKKYWTHKDLETLNVNSTKHKTLILFGGNIKVTQYIDTGEVYGPKAQKAGQKKFKKEEKEIQLTGMGVDKRLAGKTPKGNLSVDENTIKNISKKCKIKEAIDFCNYFQKAAKCAKIVSTYINHLIDAPINGILYPNFNNTATITSRLSSSRPNMQNLPKHSKLAKYIQELIIAPEDWICVQIDFSQLEVYCQALVSDDRNLIRDLNNGVDFHVKRMSWRAKIPYEEGFILAKIDKIPEWVEKRSQAKPIGFGKAYGKGVKAMAKDTGMPEEEVQIMYDAEDAEYPQVIEYDKFIMQTIKDQSRLSHKRDLPNKFTKGTQDSKSGFTRRFNEQGYELLPIRLSDGTYKFEQDVLRHVGFFQSITGKLYCWEEYAVLTKKGDIFRYYKPTQVKNYTIQGTAQDVQAVTTVELFQYLLANTDKVKMINEVHDSKAFYIKKSHLDEVLTKILAIIDRTSDILYERFGIKKKFNFKGDAEVGPNFANMQPYEPKKVA